MKKSIFTLGLIAVLSLTATSCSSDDSALDTNNTSADTGIVNKPGNGDTDLPKPTGPRL